MPLKVPEARERWIEKAKETEKERERERERERCCEGETVKTGKATSRER